LAGGDILAGATAELRPMNVIGGRVNLVSRQGSIGTAAAPLRTRVSAATGAAVSPLHLDAAAATSVHVSHLDDTATAAIDDLLVGTVTGTAGDVSLTAAGSLYDAHTWTVRADRQAEIDKGLADLGMLDTDAAIAKAVSAFQATVKSHYLR
jgi:hypothetical protein